MLLNPKHIYQRKDGKSRYILHPFNPFHVSLSLLFTILEIKPSASPRTTQNTDVTIC